jgi:hypothetical protein
LISPIFADDKSNWRAMVTIKLISVINIAGCIHGPTLCTRKSRGKEAPIQKSCSGSDTADTYFPMMGKPQEAVQSMETP